MSTVVPHDQANRNSIISAAPPVDKIALAYYASWFPVPRPRRILMLAADVFLMKVIAVYVRG
jgi:hypothetical protein